jgi:predicted transcriptional regulator
LENNLRFINNQHYNIFKTELKLSNLEIELFLLLVRKGKMTLEQISSGLNLDKQTSYEIINSLIKKNMIIEYSVNLFETFHPRFAIINRYKTLCINNNIVFKKNILIDNLAIALEKSFDAARTK